MKHETACALFPVEGVGAVAYELTKDETAEAEAFFEAIDWLVLLKMDEDDDRRREEKLYLQQREGCVPLCMVCKTNPAVGSLNAIGLKLGIASCAACFGQASLNLSNELELINHMSTFHVGSSR